jgi:CubicO group peptidase (beta-lactamase class C family)
MLKINFIPAFLLVANLLMQGCGQAEKSTSGLQSRIRQVEENLIGMIRVEGEAEGNWTIPARMAHYKVPGLTIAVIKDYQLDWAKGYGYADVSENRKVTEETLFQAASISKSLNAMGLLKLAQDGNIDLNSDINTYLKGWKFPYDDFSKGKKITISNLLSHTAGLSVHGFRGYGPHEPIPGLVDILEGKSPANSDAVRSMFEPGTAMQYSGGGTSITQLIVTDVTNTPYDVFMTAKVLAPLEMDNSFFTQPPPEAKRSVLATAYHQDGSEVNGKFHIYPEQAAAGLWTNPTDLAKYIIETQLSLEGKSAKVLDQSFTKTRLSPFVNNVGFGVFISKTGNSEYFGHDGANNGFRCAYLGSMKDGNGVVVMVNSDNGAIVQEVVNSVFSVYGWEEFKPIEKKIATLTPQQWKSLDGRYELESDPNLRLQFISENNKLILKQLWDGREVAFEAESEVEFFCRDSVFPLKFTKNEQGESIQVVAFGRDVWKRVKDQ